MEEEADAPDSGPTDVGVTSPLPNGRPLSPGISILDRLIKTCPVWLQLCMTARRAAAILSQQESGVFLVTRDAEASCMVLWVHSSERGAPGDILHYNIREEKTMMNLDGSFLVFEDIFKLVGFYCVSRDILPSPLRLPPAIAWSASLRELEAFSNLGTGFWDTKSKRGSSSSHPGNPPSCAHARPGDASPRPESDASCEIQLSAGSDSKLWFVNPIFIEDCGKAPGPNRLPPATNCLTKPEVQLPKAAHRRPPPPPPPASLHKPPLPSVPPSAPPPNYIHRLPLSPKSLPAPTSPGSSKPSHETVSSRSPTKLLSEEPSTSALDASPADHPPASSSADPPLPSAKPLSPCSSDEPSHTEPKIVNFELLDSPPTKGASEVSPALSTSLTSSSLQGLGKSSNDASSLPQNLNWSKDRSSVDLASYSTSSQDQVDNVTIALSEPTNSNQNEDVLGKSFQPTQLNSEVDSLSGDITHPISPPPSLNQAFPVSTSLDASGKSTQPPQLNWPKDSVGEDLFANSTPPVTSPTSLNPASSERSSLDSSGKSTQPPQPNLPKDSVGDELSGNSTHPVSSPPNLNQASTEIISSLVTLQNINLVEDLFGKSTQPSQPNRAEDSLCEGLSGNSTHPVSTSLNQACNKITSSLVTSPNTNPVGDLSEKSTQPSQPNRAEDSLGEELSGNSTHPVSLIPSLNQASTAITSLVALENIKPGEDLSGKSTQPPQPNWAADSLGEDLSGKPTQPPQPNLAEDSTHSVSPPPSLNQPLDSDITSSLATPQNKKPGGDLSGKPTQPPQPSLAEDSTHSLSPPPSLNQALDSTDITSSFATPQNKKPGKPSQPPHLNRTAGSVGADLSGKPPNTSTPNLNRKEESVTVSPSNCKTQNLNDSKRSSTAAPKSSAEMRINSLEEKKAADMPKEGTRMQTPVRPPPAVPRRQLSGKLPENATNVLSVKGPPPGKPRPRPPPPRHNMAEVDHSLAKPVASRANSNRSLHEKPLSPRLRHTESENCKRPAPVPPPRKNKLSTRNSSAEDGQEKMDPKEVSGASDVRLRGKKGQERCSVPTQAMKGSDSPLNSPKGGLKSQSSTTEGDSYSTSSADEDSERVTPNTPLKKSQSFMLDRAKNRLSIMSFSNVFSAFMSADRKLQKRIVELAHDKDTYFGNLVQDYKAYSLEMMAKQSSSTEMLQEIRLMMTQQKSYLVQSTELKSMVDYSLYDDDKIDAIVEAALCKCVLKPLKAPIECYLREIHNKDNSLRLLTENQLVIQDTTTTDLGITTSVPDGAIMEKIIHKFGIMHKTYSPEKKITYLLKACKLIYDSMATGNPGKPHGADDFLPVLMYVLARCDLSALLLDVEYMMELMDPALQLGEGSYYLTTTYGALEHIKNYDKITVTRQLSMEVQDSIHRWERRRTLNKAKVSRSSIQDFITISFEELDTNTRTLATKPSTTVTQVLQQCAEKFNVSSPQHYGLFVTVRDRSYLLAEDAFPQKIKSNLLKNEQKLDFHFLYKTTSEKDTPVKDLDFSSLHSEESAG